MEAPEGTSAPMSSPLGPVEWQGLVGWRARRVRKLEESTPVTLTRSGSALMLAEPGMEKPWTQLARVEKKAPAAWAPARRGKGSVIWRAAPILPSKMSPLP